MKNHELTTVVNNLGLKQPGDHMDARVTDSNRQVVKISKNNGNQKYSATRYPNGTVVETKTTKSQ